MTHEEGDEDGSVHQDQGQDGRPAVAQTVRDGSSHEDTKKGTTLTRLEQSTLPFGWDDMLFADQNAISSLKGILSNEVAVQEHVERFHDLGNVH